MHTADDKHSTVLCWHTG